MLFLKAKQVEGQLQLDVENARRLAQEILYMADEAEDHESSMYAKVGRADKETILPFESIVVVPVIDLEAKRKAFSEGVKKQNLEAQDE